MSRSSTTLTFANRSFAIAAIAASMAGCDSSENQGGKPCPAGSETCACYGNRTCDGTLVCASNVCVSLAGSSAAAGNTGVAGSTGTAGNVSVLQPSTLAGAAALPASSSAAGGDGLGGAPASIGVPIGGNVAGGIGNNVTEGGVPSSAGNRSLGGAAQLGGVGGVTLGSATLGGAISGGANSLATATTVTNAGQPTVGGVSALSGGAGTMVAVGGLPASAAGAPAGGQGTATSLQMGGRSAAGGQSSVSSNAVPLTCGNGIVDGSEGCDGGSNNQDLGDGCTPLCAIEPSCPPAGGGCSTNCGDGILAGSEGCDDGNAVSGDGCSSSCQVEAGYNCAVVPNGATLSIPMVVRDFTGTGDFENVSASGLGITTPTQGLLSAKLDASGLKPVLVSTTGAFVGTTARSSGIASAASFAQWYASAAPASGNTPSGSLVTALELFRSEDGSGYVNRWGAQGERWIRESPKNTNWCGTVGHEDRDANNNPIPCTSCLYDEDPSTPQCDPAPEKTVCTDRELLRCDVSGGTYYGVVAEASFDGTPLFFPADAIKPYSPSASATIPDYYDKTWPTEAASPLHNFSFTTEMRFWFRYDASKKYVVSVVGDDDLWVFVNKTLAIDLGGVHTPVSGSLTIPVGGTPEAVVEVQTGTYTRTTSKSQPVLDLQDGQIYEIAVFQAERQTSSSTLMLNLGGFETAATVCTAR